MINKCDIIRINDNLCTEWLLEKHYLKRIPTIVDAFGLLIDSNICGVCTFSPVVARFVFSTNPYELSRLVINENLPKNTLSHFLASSINMIRGSHIIVSYADENWGHHGYIYQATNWIYTGKSSQEKIILVDGVETHRRTIYSKYGTSSIPTLIAAGHTIDYTVQTGKHRYFQVTGTKKEKKQLRNEIIDKYGSLEYPKGENSRYDSGKDIYHKSFVNKFF